MADRISKARRSWNMSRIKGQNTTPERLLRSHLHKAGYRFRLHAAQLPGRPDIVLRKYSTVIFVHGCFWHRHTGCRNATMPKSNRAFWQSKFDDTVKRDVRNKKVLTETGWRVLTAWECEIETSPDEVVARISRQLQEGKDGA